jgi:zinc transport system substrate-binding protein
MIIVFMKGGGVAALLAALVPLLAGGCQALGEQSSAEATSDTLSIVTAAYPFQFIAEQVAGSHANVSSLTEPGAEPHDLELTPRQVGSIARADLVIYERTFQPAVDEAVVQSESRNVLDTATVVPLENHSESADGEADSGHGDEPQGPDPHVWQDPTRVAAIAEAVADRLAGIDPVNADDYRANLSGLKSRLADLDRRFRDGLSSCERTEFITTHAAFGYLAERYGLTQVGISGLSPDIEASPARIAEIHRKAREDGVTTIFFETLTSPAVAKAVAGDLGLRTDVLDPIEGITADSLGTDYFSVMAANLAALRRANGCQ